MRHRAGEAGREIAQDRNKVPMGVTLMQEDRLFHGHRKLELRDEDFALRGAWRQVAEIIQPAFPHRDDAALREQCSQFGRLRRLEADSQVRVDAGGAPQHARVPCGELQRLARTDNIRAGDNLTTDTGGSRALHDIRQVGGKACMGEIRADVNQVQGQVASRVYGIVRGNIVRPRVGRESMIRKAMVLALLAMPLTAMAQAGGDLQAQIVYAYQTEDLNALSDLEDGLRAKLAAGEADAALHYHLAHAAYRYATLAPREKGGAAGHAAGLCVDELKEILRRDERNVEALVLQSERLKKALHLAPRNPRALLIAALAGPGPERPLSQLWAAAELFGQASSTAADVPGWGDADAYLALGRELQRRGDVLGARNWIERALIASPDYRAAQRARLELSGH